MNQPPVFPAGPERMAAAIRERDWTASPLGPLVGWPADLRASVNMVFASAFPCFIVWGPQQILLYNDGYAEASLLNHGQLDEGMSILTKPFTIETLAARIRELVAG